MSTIKTIYKGDMLFETIIGNHKLTVDVPEGMGGQDRAPMPPQLFIASLGSCVGALIADYCNRNGIDASDMEIDVSFEKAKRPTRLTNIHVTTHLPHAELRDERRREALRRVAEHCPVHETIETMQGVTFEIVSSEQLSPA